MKEIPLEVGRVVLSKAGRDKGRYFIVMAIEDGDYVSIVDGELRKLERPKRKKIKHLEAKHDLSDTLKRKFEEGSRVFDAEVRSCLKNLGYKPEFSENEAPAETGALPKEG